MEQLTTSRGAINTRVVLGVFVVGLLISGVAIVYGRMDAGQIDVSATITNANNASTAAGEGPENQVQAGSNAFANMPNGGLVGTDEVPPQPPAPQEVATTTATSTEETTPSTEDMSSEEGGSDSVTADTNVEE